MSESLLTNSRTIIAELEAGTGEELGADAIARVACPVSLILGGRSAPISHAAAGRLRRILPSATRVEVADGDHTMNIRMPAAFARARGSVLASARER